MRIRRELLLLGCLLFCHALTVRAQLLDALFPEGVPGYGGEPGVTVLSRVRPAYEPLGIRIDNAMLHSTLSSSIGYDNNVFAGTNARGAWEIDTQPAMLFNIDNSAGGVGAYVSAADARYLGYSSQDHTDGTAFLGGTANIGRDRLTLGGGYLSLHEDRTALDALPSDQPVAFTVENLRAAYATNFGRFTVTPSIELNRWRFANTTILGVPTSESARDRTTVQPGAILRYAWMPGRDLLWVTRVVGTHYDDPAVGVPSNNSLAWESLIGVNYDDDTVWRYRLLGGVEYRQAESPAIASRATPIAEAEIIWSPTAMTTLHATAARGIEDAAQSGLSNFTYTSARLTLDHEYLRDILLNASAMARQASYAQTGGQQFGLSFGTGATWLINQSLRLSLTYDFADVRNSHLPTGTVAGDYTRGLSLLTFRIGL